MTSRKRSCVASIKSVLLVIMMIFALISIRYIIPVRVPGPMTHPIKYKIVTGSFALILDIVGDDQQIRGRLSDSFVFYRVDFLNRSLVSPIIQY